MADIYSEKAALRIGIVDVVSGLVSIAVGAFSTRNDDHTVITQFKPKGLPVWAGILFVITGAIGVLTYKNPRKCLIICFMMFSSLCVGGAVIVFWCIMPVLIDGQETVAWNLSYGSFLALTAITFVVSMKAIYLCFKSTVMYACNCVKRRPPRESRQAAVLELGTTYSLTSHSEERSLRRQGRSTPSHRGASGLCRSQRQHSPYSSERRRRSRDRYRERSAIHITQTEQSRERLPLNFARTVHPPVPVVHVQRPPQAPPPPPPPYQTMKFPYLPSYTEVEATIAPPPPYTEK
ncbi:uncharacterized protein LOC110249420 [Exaiptasia diaphana]|uniref:Uncharacterized protein n=1 Tax=Exaiptasia diaphana TaxID=2652724 RepID=A0A913XXY5_EXADI|nr:uncharacterized protein LOC110249420 [Exaiptasia diaphana]KXJ29263.1 hypothetical protein AC249_AIPGENE29010 [Exaiptasia diaphana]